MSYELLRAILYELLLLFLTRTDPLLKDVRRIGRPSAEWLTEVFKAAVRFFGSRLEVERMAMDKSSWDKR